MRLRERKCQVRTHGKKERVNVKDDAGALRDEVCALPLALRAEVCPSPVVCFRCDTAFAMHTGDKNWTPSQRVFENNTHFFAA